MINKAMMKMKRNGESCAEMKIFQRKLKKAGLKACAISAGVNLYQIISTANLAARLKIILAHQYLIQKA